MLYSTRIAPFHFVKTLTRITVKCTSANTVDNTKKFATVRNSADEHFL